MKKKGFPKKIVTKDGVYDLGTSTTLASNKSFFYMLFRNVPYQELGANYFDERRRHYTVDWLTRRIEHLGYRVHLEPVAAPAA